MDRETCELALYYFGSCPYCVRVRRVIDRLQLTIELRNIRRDRKHRQDLASGGGRTMVPCLRIEQPTGPPHWLYESADIKRYLEHRFGNTPS